MSDDLDLRVIDQRHEPDPEFRAALRRRVAGIVSGEQMSDSPTEPPELVTIDLELPARRSRRMAWVRLAAAAAAAAVILAALAVVISHNATTTPTETPVPTSVARRTFDPGQASPLEEPSHEETLASNNYSPATGQIEVTAAGNYVYLRSSCSAPGESCGGHPGWAYGSGTVGGTDRHGLLGNADEMTVSALDDRYFVAFARPSSEQAPQSARAAWLIDSVTGRRGALTLKGQPATLTAPQQWLVLFPHSNFEPGPRFLPHVVDSRDWTIRPLAVPADATAALQISQTGTGRIWVGTAPNGGTLGLAYTDDGGASWTRVELPSPLRIMSEQVIGNFLSVAATQHSVAVTSASDGSTLSRDLLVSTDAGRHWTDVPFEPPYLGNGRALFALPNGQLVVVLETDGYAEKSLVSITSTDWSSLESGYVFPAHLRFEISQGGISMVHTYAPSPPFPGDELSGWTIPTDQQSFVRPAP